MKFSLYSLFILILLSSCSAEPSKADSSSISVTSDNRYKTYLNQLTDSLNRIDSKPFSEFLNTELVNRDLEILERSMKEVQTSLYRYTDSAIINSLFETASSHDKDSISYFEFTQHLAKIFSEVGCLHSGWGHTKAYKTYRNENLKFFPFKIAFINDECYVLKNYSDVHTIQPGDRIRGINNTPIKQVFDELKNYMVADGQSESFKEKAIADYFPIAYSNFISKPEFFLLDMGYDDSITVLLHVKALSKAQIDEQKSKEQKQLNSQKKPTLQYSIDPSNQVLTYSIGSFQNEVLAHGGQNFEQFTDSVFEKITSAEIEHLIIDIRNNSGGWTANGKHLFSYFIEKETSYIKSVKSLKQSDYSFESLIVNGPAYHDTMVFNKMSWMNYPNLKAIPQSKNKFKGQAFILVNETSNSCSSVFASLMKEHKKATLVGREAGGSHGGSNAMTVSFQLPFSGIGITLSTAKYDNAVSNPTSKGVMPDFIIEPTIEDLLKNKDPQLDKVLSLIFPVQ